MRILVTFAVEAEFAPWRRLREFAKSHELASSYAGVMAAYVSKAGNDRIEVLLTGIGRESCERIFANHQIAPTDRPDIVISSGLAGALRQNLKPGDLVAARTTRTLNNETKVDSDLSCLRLAADSGAIPIDTLITADRIVPTAEEKSRLAYSGEVVEMESAFILNHFARLGVPVLALRGISDSANEDLPLDFDRCLTPQGEIKPMNLINQIVRRPGNLPSLIRFGRQSSQAAQNLAQFMDKFVETVTKATCGAAAR